jgi:DNA-binding winged helix-turn-helix (wHTH) protein/TolB-like protein/Flp pilus assembly protein TadD
MVAVREAEERLWHFGEFVLDVDSRLLLRNGEALPIGPKAFDLLVVLFDRRGKVLSKQFLLDTVWPDTIVDVNNLNQQVAALRKVLEDARYGWIETVPRVGFRFRAEPNPSLELVPRKWSHARTVAAVGIAAAILVVAARLLPSRQPSHQTLHSLAVLPLRSQSAGPEDVYLGLAIADALTHRFAASEQLSVRPTTAISRYIDRKIEPRMAGKELQVEAVIVGTVSRTSKDVTATIRLIRVADGQELWSHRFTSPAERLFSFPDEIYRSIAGDIGVPYTARRVRYEPPAAAYEAYLKGAYYFSRRTSPDFARAESAFRTALAIDPHYAAAWAGLGDALGFQDKLAEAAVANEQALEIDDASVEAHSNVALGGLLNHYDFALARREFERALALDPTNPQTHHWYAYYFVAIGDFNRALAEMETARRDDPSSLIIQTDIGNILFRARKYDAAIAQLQRVIKTDGTFAQAHHDLALAYEMVGRGDDAIREMRRAGELNDHFIRSALLAQIYAATGRESDARAQLQQAIQDDASYLCMAYAALGDKPTALDLLERAYHSGSAEVALLNANPLFDPLRNEPRFEAIARRLRP